MIHDNLMTDKDKADLERAAELIAEGRKLRTRVYGRLRARAHREKTNG